MADPCEGSGGHTHQEFDAIFSELSSHEMRITTLEGASDPVDPDPDPVPPPDDDAPGPGAGVALSNETATLIDVVVTWPSSPGITYVMDLRNDDGASNPPFTGTSSPTRPQVGEFESPFTWTVTKTAAVQQVQVQVWDGASPLVLTSIAIPSTSTPPPAPPPPTPPQPPPATPPPPVGSGPSGVSPGPNEPGGMTTIIDGPFDSIASMRAQGWGMLDPKLVTSPVDGGQATDMDIVADGDFPNSPVGQNTHLAGHGDDALWPGTRGRSGGTRMWYNDNTLGAVEIYASFRFKFDPAWTISSGNFKICGLRSPYNGGSQWLWVTQGGDPTAPMRIGIDQKQRNSNGSNIPVIVNSGSQPLTLGVVHQIEVHSGMNSAAGVADGFCKIWVNNVLVVNATTLIFYEDAAFPAQTFAGFVWDPIPGGRTVSTEQWCRMDDIYVSAK